MGRFQEEKLVATFDTFRRSPPDHWTILPGFSVTVDELSKAADIDRALVERILAAFTLPHGEKNQYFRALHDFNVANATPLLRAEDGTYQRF
jgi:hypothetical protein